MAEIETPSMAGMVVLISGSTQGIGEALATACAMQGACVVINGRSADALAALEERLRRRGTAILAVRADISQPEEAQKLVDSAFAAFGHVDVLINNAAIAGPSATPAWAIKASDWTDVIAINLSGAFHCSAAYVRRMLEHAHSGRILNALSSAARDPVAGLSPYCVSKAGLLALTKCLALDIGSECIAVAGLEFDSHRTEMTRTRLAPEEYSLLPGPETAASFIYWGMTAPVDLIHGRVFSERRFSLDMPAEARLASELAACSVFTPRMPRYRKTDVGMKALHLDFLENPLGASPHAVAALEKGGASVSLYPDPRLTQLRQTLALEFGLTEDSFAFGNGSSEIVERLLRVFAQPGDVIVTTDPTWPMLEKLCGLLGLELRLVRYELSADGAHLDPDLLVRSIDSRTRVVYLTNPNYPLATWLDTTTLSELATRFGHRTAIVVDEAYVEFAGRQQSLRVPRMVQAGAQIIGVRTFSKFYGLAGIRLGYAYGLPTMIDLMKRLELPFSVSSLAQKIAAEALMDQEQAIRVLDANRRGLAQVGAALAKLGLRSLHSDVNYLMTESPAAPERIYDEMNAKGIFLPEVVWRGFIQLPIADAASNDCYLNLLQEFTNA